MKKDSSRKEHKMRYPDFLQPNGTIGFLAPAFGCSTQPYLDAFDHSLDKWKALGFNTVLGPNCYAGDGVGISTSPKKCGEEVNEMFKKDDVDCLLSCGGGELMCEILDHVDFEALRTHEPKWFMGYSDNTNLVHLLVTLCDTAAIYGPCAPAFGMEPWHAALQDALDIIMGKKTTVTSYPLWEAESLKDESHPLEPYNVTMKRILTVYEPDRGLKTVSDPEYSLEAFSGRLLGGCLDCLVNLTGTIFDKTSDFCEKYKENGIIWFLESCDLNVFSMRRAMWELEHAGWFKYVKGFLIGRPLNGEEMFGLDRYQAILHIAKEKNVPVLFDLDIGHRPPMMPLVEGSLATVNVKGDNVTIRMEYK